MSLKSKIEKDKYEYASFHPSKYYAGIYVVRRHEKGQKWLDRYIDQTEVVAKSESDAIRKAKKEWKER